MKIFFVSLGCDKNLVDTEFMLGLLSDAGFEFTSNETQAEVIIINTCSFIHDAKEESINTILEMAEYKKNGRTKALIVTGCLAQRYKDEIKEQLPEVDAILGTNSWDCIVEAINTVYEQKNYALSEKDEHSGNNDNIHLEPEVYSCMKALDGLPEYKGSRILTKGTHFAYLKIAEGCSKRCTYCAIPYIRGNYRSVPMEVLIAQAEELVEKGIKELILVAQETTVYGTDLYGSKTLHILLQKLSEIPRLRWIRIMYCYPEEIYPELIAEIKNNPKICHYLDLPIQHVNNEILQKMARRTTKEELIQKITMLRTEIPDIALRTTIICGFPGETEEQHEELMYFLNEMEFDRLGAFAYSQEEGTAAAELPDQISEEQKNEWRDDVMELNEEIISDKNESLIGSTMEVIVEGYISEENAYVCRTYRDAPEVDGYLFFATSEVLNTGDFARVKVTGAYEYDLIGELV